LFFSRCQHYSRFLGFSAEKQTEEREHLLQLALPGVVCLSQKLSLPYDLSIAKCGVHTKEPKFPPLLPANF
jgi:hypothetical protein